MSSTSTDLQEHRQAVLDALRGSDEVQILAHEYFAASPKSPQELILDVLLECDLFVSIIGRRYGAILPGEEKSASEIEYDTAISREKPVLIYLLHEDTPVLSEAADVQVDLERFEKFKQRLKSRHTLSYFSTPEDLARQVVAGIYNFLQSGESSR